MLQEINIVVLVRSHAAIVIHSFFFLSLYFCILFIVMLRVLILNNSLNLSFSYSTLAVLFQSYSDPLKISSEVGFCNRLLLLLLCGPVALSHSLSQSLFLL